MERQLPKELADAVKKEAERQADLYDVSARESKAFEAGASFLYSIQPTCRWVKCSDRLPPIVKNSVNLTIIREIKDHRNKKIVTYSKSPICELNRNPWKWEWLDEYQEIKND